MRSLEDGFNAVCKTWALDSDDKMKLLRIDGRYNDLVKPQQDYRMLSVIGISMGLGDLFDDDAKAEVEWLNTPRDELEGKSALEHMLEGGAASIRDVADLVEQARGLR